MFINSFGVKLKYFSFIAFIAYKRLFIKIFKYVLLFKDPPSKFIPDVVLVLKIGGLGDFIFGIPALNLLRERLPNAKIILITSKSLSNLSFKYSNQDPLDLSRLPWTGLVRSSVDKIVAVPDLSIRMIGRISNLIPSGKILGIFVLGYPGMTIASAIKKILFVRLLIGGSRVCVGVDKKYDDRFMRKFQGNQDLYRHKMLGDIDSVMEGFSGSYFLNSDLNFTFTKKSISNSHLANAIGLDNLKKYIIIAPSATTMHKQWPLENFSCLIKTLKNNYEQCEFLLVGTNEQSDQAEQICKNIGFNITNLCGRMSIDELAAFFSVVKGYIGNDGGMSQLAGLVGCPSVIVFNSVEEDWITHPWLSANGVIRNRTSCSPCYSNTYCLEGHNKCMLDISVESVLLKVNQIIFKSDEHVI